MDCDVSFVFPGPINFCSWNKTFKFNNNLLKSATVLVCFRSDSVNSAKFRLFYINIQTVLDITFNFWFTLFLLDLFSFTSKPLNLRDSPRPYCSRASIFLDFNSSWDSNYASLPSKLVILYVNFSMDASLAFSFSSNVDIFSVRFFIRALCSSIKLLRESISLGFW